MNILSTIGQQGSSIQYTDRPTVKVIIKNADKILLIDEGFLPGGGVDPGESDSEAITRELKEELGSTIKDIQKIGTVVQYRQHRDLSNQKYLINGYTAELETIGGPTNPQNEGEAQFTTQWLSLDEAIVHVEGSINKVKPKPLKDTGAQARLYNLMTTLEFLKAIA